MDTHRPATPDTDDSLAAPCPAGIDDDDAPLGVEALYSVPAELLRCGAG